MTLNPSLRSAKKALLKAGRLMRSRLPPPSSRLIGVLAKDGGTPVRNVRLRPWVQPQDGNFRRWHTEMRGVFRRIYLGGTEGLPQPLAERFAQQWAAYCGCRYGLLLTNGTDALRIGLAAVLDHDGLDYGGEIIVPNFSFIASATAPLDRRFGVVFVDVDESTLLLNPRSVEEAVVPGKTRAILPVHLFGQPADMTALRAIADKYELKIVEDAAQAHGAVWATGPVGSLGHVAAFSFQSSKNLSCGEGGALTTDNEQVLERAYSMHNAGRPRIGGCRWDHPIIGLNCRPTEYQAGLLFHRFAEFERMQEIRRKNFSYLRELMSNVKSLKPLALSAGVRAHGMYMFAMRYDQKFCGGTSIDTFLELVQSEGIPITRAFQTTISNQPAMQALRKKHPSFLRSMPTPVADQAAREVVYIPQNVFLGTTADIDEVVAAVHKVEQHCSTSA